jgi:hypothetical protein
MMKHLALSLLFFAILAGPVHAQSVSPDEIAFWETVRDSRNPAELQAYIDQYPNGKFVVLAKVRLAALGQKPAAPPVKAGEMRIPKVGDTWTYRLTPVRGWGSPMKVEPPRRHEVKVDEVEQGRIVDQLSVDGGTPVSSTHVPGRTLLSQGASVFSPYLLVLETLPPSGRLAGISIRDCGGNYICEAKGRVVGSETVIVPAGKFVAIKVIIDQEWRARSVSGHAAGQLNGGRTLTVWYAPEASRAVKYSSRLVVGDIPPIDADFDLELISFQVK